MVCHLCYSPSVITECYDPRTLEITSKGSMKKMEMGINWMNQDKILEEVVFPRTLTGEHKLKLQQKGNRLHKRIKTDIERKDTYSFLENKLRMRDTYPGLISLSKTSGCDLWETRQKVRDKGVTYYAGLLSVAMITHWSKHTQAQKGLIWLSGVDQYLKEAVEAIHT